MTEILVGQGQPMPDHIRDQLAAALPTYGAAKDGHPELAVPCPTCHALDGHGCRRPSGGRREPHQDRITAWINSRMESPA